MPESSDRSIVGFTCLALDISSKKGKEESLDKLGGKLHEILVRNALETKSHLPKVDRIALTQNIGMFA